MRAFSIANVASNTILKEHTEPWVTAPAIPAEFRTDRDAYKKWMCASSSMVPLFSLVEGETPGLRCTTANPAFRIHGIITDYDAVLSPEDVQSGLKRIPARFPIFAWNRTRRGGVRAVWRFEEPVFVYSAKFYEQFLRRIAKELALDSLWPGFDLPPFLDPHQYYAAGDGWAVDREALIPSRSTTSWTMDCLKRVDDFGAPEIPLDVVEAEVHKLFPGRWQGRFEVGARGVRFWDPGADNPTAAVIRPSGVCCFTGSRGFVPWADILGKAFVDAFRENKLGAPGQELYTDGKSVFFMGASSWVALDKEAARRHLKVKYGLSAVPNKGESVSDLERVLHFIETERRVVCLAPFPALKERVVNLPGGRRFLNSSPVRPLRAAPGRPAWGEGFPKLAEYLSTLMLDQNNLDMLIAEIAVGYRNHVDGSGQRGHAVFVAGPAGTGKTLLTYRVLGGLHQCHADVTALIRNAQFSSSMFHSNLWCVDDLTGFTDRKSNQRFTGFVKQLVANPVFSYNEKYGYSGPLPVNARLWVTLNDDADSLSVLPDLESGTADKITLLRTGSKRAHLGENEQEIMQVLQDELPYFAAYLLTYQYASWIPEDLRYGIAAWQDWSLRETAEAESQLNSTTEMLQLWRKSYDLGPQVKWWTGTATALNALLLSGDRVVANMNRYVNARLLGKVTERLAANAPTNEWCRRRRSNGKYLIEIRLKD